MNNYEYKIVKWQVVDDPLEEGWKMIRVMFARKNDNNVKYLAFKYNRLHMDIISKEVRDAMHRSIEAEAFKERIISR